MTHRFPVPPPVALSALKRKKRYEKQLQQIDGTLSTIEMQREALEGANTNTAVLQTMGEAAKALKAAHKHMYVPPRRCGGDVMMYGFTGCGAAWGGDALLWLCLVEDGR